MDAITLHTETLRDARLSLETRGALAYLLTEPDRRRLPDILMAHGVGKSRVFRMIRELKGGGYLRVHAPRKQADGTYSGWWYELVSRPGEFSTDARQ
jgi:hypothetical protein